MNDHKDAKKKSKDTAKQAEKPESKAPADAKKEKKKAGGLPRRTVFLLTVIVLVTGILMWRQYLLTGQSPGSSTTVGVSGMPQIGGAFSLVNQDGRAVTEADFLGKYMLVYFGYTFCPDVCPTSLSTMADALDLIGDKADRITPVFITVDPERDTPEQMKMYVGYFYPTLVGLSGTVDQVAAAANVYKAYYAKAVTDSDGEYLMDHSSITYLMGPDGKFVAHFGHGVEPDEMAKRLNELIK